MDEFCEFIGIFVVTAVMFAIPILCTCSFALGWDARVAWTLTILTMIDFFMGFECVDDKVMKK
jgi:hypothetical protein